METIAKMLKYVVVFYENDTNIICCFVTKHETPFHIALMFFRHLASAAIKPLLAEHSDRFNTTNLQKHCEVDTRRQLFGWSKWPLWRPHKHIEKRLQSMERRYRSHSRFCCEHVSITNPMLVDHFDHQ